MTRTAAQALFEKKDLSTEQVLTEKLPGRQEADWGYRLSSGGDGPAIGQLYPYDSPHCVCFVGSPAALSRDSQPTLTPPFFSPSSPFNPLQLIEALGDKGNDWFANFLPRGFQTSLGSPSIIVVPDILCDREEMGAYGGNEACSVLAGIAQRGPRWVGEEGVAYPRRSENRRNGERVDVDPLLSSFVVIPASRGHLVDACVEAGSEIAFDCRGKRDGDQIAFVDDGSSVLCVVKPGVSRVVDFLYESVAVIKALDDVAREFFSLFRVEPGGDPSAGVSIALRLIDVMAGGGVLSRWEPNILAFNGQGLSKQEELGLRGLFSMAETFLLYAEAGEPFRLLREEIHDDLRGKLLVWEKVLSNNRIKLDLRVPNFPGSKGKRFSNLNGVFVGSTPPSVTDVPGDEQRAFEEKLAGVVSRLGEALGIFPLIDAVDAGVCVDDLLGALEEG